MLALLFWQAAFDVDRIDIAGLRRFTPDAVLLTIGLKPKAKATKADFDTACQTLIKSGLFEACSWKYVPSSNGIILTFELKEAPAEQKVRLTVPGVTEADLWSWLRTNGPLVQPQMPGSDDAITFYTAAIRRYLKQDVTASIDTNLQTHETTLVFRPANLEKISTVKFQGADAIPSATLEAKIAPVAKGLPFTEYDVKQLLETNIRPMYDEFGRLNASFPSIRREGREVTIQVQEGRVYTVGEVKATGVSETPKLSAGEVANWRRVTEALDATLRSLRNQGFIEAKYNVQRRLNDSAGIVDISVAYDRGTLFTFGKLKLEGLNPAQESVVRQVWAMKEGAPMNEGYIDDFIKAAFGKLGNEFSGVASQMDPAGTNVVNVSITFRRR
jgi:outer membrane protein assembly factor BamA